MPWCPKCLSEYMGGTETCSDCDCTLVEQAPVRKFPIDTVGFLRAMIKPAVISMIAMFLPIFLMPWSIQAVSASFVNVALFGAGIITLLMGFCYGYFSSYKPQLLPLICGCLLFTGLCIILGVLGISSGNVKNPILFLFLALFGIPSIILTITGVYLGSIIPRCTKRPGCY